MDIEDPIRKLLSTTGWSCDDLLEKLQKFKSSNTNTDAEKNVFSKPTSGDSSKNLNINDSSAGQSKEKSPEPHLEAPTESNSSSVPETYDVDTSNSQVDLESYSGLISGTNTKDGLKIQSYYSLASTTNEHESQESNSNQFSPNKETDAEKSQTVPNGTSLGCSPVPETTLDDGNTTLEFPVIANTSTSSSNSTAKQDSVIVVDEFSDTDEEEDEVNNTNSSIINEIIEDIDKGDNVEEQATVTEVIAKDTEGEQTTEITEVRVIEINSDEDDDDDFEDECYNPSKDSERPNKTQYLEVHPRQNHNDPPELVSEVMGAKEDAMSTIEKEAVNVDIPEEVNISIDADKSESTESTETQNSVAVTTNHSTENDVSVHIEDSEDSNEPIDNTDKIVIINDDTQTCHAHIEDSSSESLCATKIIDDIEAEQTSSGSKDSLGKIKILENCLIEPARSNGSSSPNEAIEEENENPEHLEDIRNNLKKQLSCLRTRKKEHFLKDLTSKLDNTFECNEKKIANFGKKLAAIDEEKRTTDDNQLYTQINDNELYTQTNELGFVIASVQGGIELEDPVKDKTEDENSLKIRESSADCDETSPHQDDQVFDEIRRIIRKQKPHVPRIYVNKELAKPPGEFHTNRSSLTTSSPENSQSSFTLEKNTKQISPFVSNTLDEFLTGDAKLNISYNVPKCGAEEGLKEKSQDVSPLLLKRVVKFKEESDTPNKLPVTKLKAKTVAQKRKLLEMEHKKKLKQMKKEERKLKAEIKPEGYVMMDGKKLWVKSSTPNTCIATINTSKGFRANSRQRKLSLLKKKKHHQKLKYLPGPLCRKQTLQMNGLGHWETQLRTLPKVILEVEPKIGQPICYIARRRLPPCDGNITENQIDFALSVLKTEPTKPQKFVFPMHYRNHQEQIIVKKRKASPVRSNLDPPKVEKKSEDVIAEVIDGLIRYVEIKEIAPTLIKEEFIQPEDKVEAEGNSTPIVDENISVFKKPAKRKSKINMELLRLSCKVVSVEVEEKDEEKPCTKPYCRLGCVCKSIKCENVPNLHCQKVKCMFECSCPKDRHWTYDHKFTLPAGSNVLATDTVTRIEDEAKRNLAKVERDFTQTIIYTNDKTIVVGLGARNRTKRLTKAPRKYADYYEPPEDANEPDERDFLRANCSVSLPRLNLTNIVPFCLEHNLYDCHCRGQSNYLPRKHKDTSVLSNRSYSERVLPKYVKPVEVKRQCIPLKPKSNLEATKEIQSGEETSSEVIGYELNMKPKRTRHRSSRLTKVEGYPGNAARVNPIPKYSKGRRHLNASKYDFINNITDADICKAQIRSTEKNQQLLEVDILKEYLIQLAQKTKADIEEAIRDNASGKNKRKQILEVRKDDLSQKNADRAMQRRKKAIAARQVAFLTRPIFNGEIIVDHTNMELLKKMGPRTVQDGFARLLPWKALSEAYNNGTIIIWSMIGQPSRLLMNKSDKRAPKNYINIKNTTHTTEVIMWILRGKLPPFYQEDNVSFILRETKDNFEICGVCTKNLRNGLEHETVTESEADAFVQSRGPITSFIHRDSQGYSQSLDLVKEKFKLQELMEESLGAYGDTSVKHHKLYMWVELPEIYSVYKWKMIYLNSDFAYLFFNSIKYSIKYTDLIAAGRISKSSNYTVILRNKQMLEKYVHKQFGLYFDPNYLDRLFIGPYLKQFQEHDVETMRYINKTLVCTESFNKMSGKGDYKCGHWLIERPYNRAKRPSNESTIDLTNDDAADNAKPISEHNNVLIMHNNEQVRIIDAPPRKPEDFNRYLITNIPHFGYLGAYQHANTSDIDVSWPFENKMLRFPNVTTAIDFLQERFSTLLQPVPASFNIHIIVLTSIDFTNSKPIDANVLSGHFICGDFGYYNILQITNEICMEKIGKSKEQVLRMFARKAQKIVRKRASALCSLLDIQTDKDPDIIQVIDTATKEIRELREQEKQFITLKNELSNKKKDSAVKVFNMISYLPDAERNKECIKFRAIINNTETIEIADSDEEEKQSPPPSKETATISGLNSVKQVQTKMQSVLKPLIRVPIDQATSFLARAEAPTTEQASSNPEDSKHNIPGRLIKGVKLIKTSTGSFVIVPDKTKPAICRNLSPGTKIVIKNNKIQSFSKIEGVADDHDYQVHSEGALISKSVGDPDKSLEKPTPTEIVEKVANAESEPVFDTS